MSYLGIIDSTCDVERLFSKLQLLEMKRRERHLGIFALRDAVKVAIECPGVINELIIKAPAECNRAGQQVVVAWQPKPLILKAQVIFAESFGKKRLGSRSLVPARGAAARGLQLLARRPKLSLKQRKKAPLKTKGERAAEWRESVKVLVEQSKAGAAPVTATLLGDGVRTPATQEISWANNQ